MTMRHIKNWFDPEKKFLHTPVGIFLVGAILGCSSPDPTDAIHFWLQAHVLNNPAIAESTRVFFQVFDWYFLTASYFFLLLVLAYILHIQQVSTVKRLTVVGGVLGIGAVIGIIAQVYFS